MFMVLFLSSHPPPLPSLQPPHSKNTSVRSIDANRSRYDTQKRNHNLNGNDRPPMPFPLSHTREIHATRRFVSRSQSVNSPPKTEKEK